MTIYEKLAAIQKALKAPKTRTNQFGGYKYRRCEDVLEAVKPLLDEQRCVLLLSDSIEEHGDRFYVQATAKLVDIEAAESGEISVVAYAREEETKKGMDSSQITGAASSYARKYALNGLFCLDDNEDSDATNDDQKAEPKRPERKAEPKRTEQVEQVCAACGVDIANDVFNWSMRYYDKPLCRDCQKKAQKVSR